MRGVDDGLDEGVDPNSSALISQLRDEVTYLGEASRRKDEIIMQQAMTMRQLAVAPQEPTEAAETVEEEQGRVEPQSAAVEAQVTVRPPQQRSEWHTPVNRLPLWHYILGLLIVFLSAGLSYDLAYRMPVGTPVVLGLALVFAAAWTPSGAFGFWVGFRQRDPRLRSEVIRFGALVGAALALGPLVYRLIGFWLIGRQSLEGAFKSVFVGLPPWWCPYMQP